MPQLGGGAQISGSGQIADEIILSADIKDNEIVDADIKSSAAIAASKIAGDVETTGDQSIAGVKTFTDDPLLNDEAYGPAWNGVLEPPTKNAVYDKIETLASGTPIFQQRIATEQAATALASGDLISGCNSAGTVWYKFDSNKANLSRFALNTGTGAFERTHTIDPTIAQPSGDVGSLVVIGSFLYFVTNDGTNIKVVRFAAADLTGETIMTVPTVACTANSLAWTDGTYLFVVSQTATTTTRKWSVSGTTFSAVDTATFYSNGPVQQFWTTFWNGTNVYMIWSDNDWTSTQVYITKFSDVYGVAAVTTNYLFNEYSPGNDYGFVAIPISANKFYIGRWSAVFNATAQITAHVILDPTTLP